MNELLKLEFNEAFGKFKSLFGYFYIGKVDWYQNKWTLLLEILNYNDEIIVFNKISDILLLLIQMVLISDQKIYFIKKNPF